MGSLLLSRISIPENLIYKSTSVDVCDLVCYMFALIFCTLVLVLQILKCSLQCLVGRLREVCIGPFKVRVLMFFCKIKEIGFKVVGYISSTYLNFSEIGQKTTELEHFEVRHFD